MTDATGREYIQIGVTAARDPQGNFLPAIPIWAPATPELAATEERFIREIGALFAEKMRQYVEGGGQIKKSGKRKAEAET